MKKWRCKVCGYIHTGDEPPAKCPVCNASKDDFILVESETEALNLHYTAKVTTGSEPEINQFFESYESLAAFIYNLPVNKAVPLHKHPTTDELFYVIKGKIQFTIGETVIDASEGEILQGKMNIPHTFKNIGSEPAVFLSVKGPKPVDLEFIGE